MHRSDEEQIQLLKEWWKKYGTLVLVVIFILAASNFVWRYWRQYHTQQIERASLEYMQMLSVDRHLQKTEFRLFVGHLMQDYKHTPYASFAAFLLAKEAILNNDLSLALENLTWIISNAKDKSIKQIARIRAARILLADNKIKEALEVIETIDDKAFLPAIYEVRGDIKFAIGDRAAALKLYQNALESSRADTRSTFIAMKVAI